MILQDFLHSLRVRGVQHDVRSTDCRGCLRLARHWNGHDGTWYLV